MCCPFTVAPGTFQSSPAPSADPAGLLPEGQDAGARSRDRVRGAGWRAGGEGHGASGPGGGGPAARRGRPAATPEDYSGPAAGPHSRGRAAASRRETRNPAGLKPFTSPRATLWVWLGQRRARRREWAGPQPGCRSAGRGHVRTARACAEGLPTVRTRRPTICACAGQTEQPAAYAGRGVGRQC